MSVLGKPALPTQPTKSNTVSVFGPMPNPPTQPTTKSNGLQRKKAYINVLDASPPKKQKQLPSPYPT